jgi:hypothetical protein
MIILTLPKRSPFSVICITIFIFYIWNQLLRWSKCILWKQYLFGDVTLVWNILKMEQWVQKLKGDTLAGVPAPFFLWKNHCLNSLIPVTQQRYIFEYNLFWLWSPVRGIQNYVCMLKKTWACMWMCPSNNGEL